MPRRFSLFQQMALETLSQLPGPQQVSVEVEGKWKIVIHTFGRKWTSRDAWNKLDKVPSVSYALRGWCPTDLSEQMNGGEFDRYAPGHPPVDFDAVVHFGSGSEFELRDPNSNDFIDFGVKSQNYTTDPAG